MSDPFRAALKAAGLDPRRTLARPDVADAALEGQVASESFLAPSPAAVTRGKTALLRHPQAGAPRETELMFGEPVQHLSSHEGFAFVQSLIDGYAGYVEEGALGPSLDADHRLKVPASFLYPAPDIKTGPVATLYFGARFKALPCKDERFLEVEGAGFLFARHGTRLDEREKDFVAVAEGFLHAPYLWGGRSVAGLDCSALVQLSLLACGIPCPRDTDMQWDELGKVLGDDIGALSLKRGDLVFWDGHVGIMQSEAMLIHANGYHMQVVSEPVGEAVSRIAALYGPVKGVKRL